MTTTPGTLKDVNFPFMSWGFQSQMVMMNPNPLYTEISTTEVITLQLPIIRHQTPHPRGCSPAVSLHTAHPVHTGSPALRAAGPLPPSPRLPPSCATAPRAEQGGHGLSPALHTCGQDSLLCIQLNYMKLTISP